jgi:hypothetical protein
MIDMIKSGGQSGADQAGWEAARAAGLATGGWMPPGYLTDEGPRPEFAARYGAREMESGGYRERTIRNVAEADAVILFAWGIGGHTSPGSRLTLRLAIDARKPIQVIDVSRGPDGRIVPTMTVGWLAGNPFRTLMIAGNRKSVASLIGPAVEAYLGRVFAAILGIPAAPG